MGALQDLKDNILGTEKQNKEAQANLDKQASQGSGLAKALGGKPDIEAIRSEAAKKAHEEYTNNRSNWPLNAKEDAINSANAADKAEAMAKGKGMKKGGKVSSASKRADGCITKGHTKGRFV